AAESSSGRGAHRPGRHVGPVPGRRHATDERAQAGRHPASSGTAVPFRRPRGQLAAGAGTGSG
ncbi:MAG: hypothetical protein S0880_35990, partial [Actinomycetota bacterium]|nr:hypothetical protein [Actinomycetota bacterium]